MHEARRATFELFIRSAIGSLDPFQSDNNKKGPCFESADGTYSKVFRLYLRRTMPLPKRFGTAPFPLFVIQQV